MKTVILCGGKGTRMRDETEFRPKPMVLIGGYPILWHIMRTYAAQGHQDFILCLGHLGDMIREYVGNLMHPGDIIMAETGKDSGTGHRLKQLQPILNETFLLTYGDGLADVDINAAIASHRAAGKLLTVTACHPPGRYGELWFDDTGKLLAFNEKPKQDRAWVNGGFMVCEPGICDFIDNEVDTMLERHPMEWLVNEGQVNTYKHQGFFQPMDTPQEMEHLNKLWNSSNAEWKVWP